jgi:iron complex outermembrane recepter protein
MLKKSRWINPTLMVAAAALPTSVFAQQGILEEVVVTAQKREQSLQDVPISVSVLSGESLAATKIDTTVDLALSTPSLNFQGGFAPHAGSFAIRGIGTFALEGGIQPSVSFVVDGVPIARVGEFSADMADIERVEILRGPQGTLFGRNATAGAINLVRKNPSEEFEAYAGGSVTDDDEYIVRVGVNGALTDNINGRLSGFWKDYDGFIENKYSGDDEGDEESYGLVGKLDIMLSSTLSVLLTGDYRDTDTSNSPSVVTRVEDGPIGDLRLAVLGDGDPAQGQRIVNDPFKINSSYRQLADADAWGVSADVTWDLTDDITLKSISAYRSYEVEMGIDVDATPSNAANPLMPITGVEYTNFNPNGFGNPPLNFDTDYFSQELRLEGRTGDFEWIGGVFYSDYTDKPANEVPLLIDCTVLDPSGSLCNAGVPGLLQSDAHTAEATWESAAIFGDVTWYLTDRFNVFAGLRWTWEDVDLDYDRTDRGVAAVPGQGWYEVLSESKVFIDPEACHPALTGAGLCFANQTKFSRSESEDDWSGRIGASWDVSDFSNVYVSASRGFVGSGVNFGRTATYENSMLEPSVSTSYELGTKSTFFDNSLRLNGAIFWQEIEDLQTSALVPGTVVTETFNAGDMTSYGFETDVTWAATQNLTFDLKLTYLDTEISDLEQACYPGQTEAQGCNINPDEDGVFKGQDVDGENGVQAPEWSYRASGRYDLPLSSMPFDLFGVVAYTWQDEMQFKLTQDPYTMQDSYGLMDITIGLQDKAGRYDVSIFGKNVTDEEFYLNMDATEVVIGRQYVRMSRQAQAYWGIQARYNFF